MEFTPEQITETGLSEEQVTKVQELTGTHEAELKKDWDGKANTDAERIIQGAADRVETLTGIKREEGVKIADYLGLASENFLKGQKSALEQKELELDKKIKEGGGDATIKQELEDTKSALDVLKQKEAKFADYEKNDYKTKYENATQKLSSQTLEIAFGKVKPSFPESVNQYEAKGRWKEFKENVLSKYEIKLDDEGEAIAVDKTNEYKIVKLESLVKENETISTLVKGRDAKGLGSGKTNIKVEGVPFEVPDNATPVERQNAIKDYLTGELKLSVTSSEYTKQFSELNKKILEKTPQK